MEPVRYCPRCLHQSGEFIYYALRQTSCAVCRCAVLLPVVEPDPCLPSIERVLSDPAASFWLKAAIRLSLERDPVDAANDADMLAKLLDSRCRKLLARDGAL